MIICPLCSGDLTRHVCQHKICWFCLSCRQMLSDLLVERYNFHPSGSVEIAEVIPKTITPPKRKTTTDYPPKLLAS
ncbi:MAG: hypothetical protein SWJ54_07050 [Cyanobacteriota bacterium]|nr:hypothetical protein [Cyanobacteriota bacterium]